MYKLYYPIIYYSKYKNLLIPIIIKEYIKNPPWISDTDNYDKEQVKKDLNVTNKELNKIILNKKYLGSYYTFEGCPASKGLLQFDLWNEKPSDNMISKWDLLKQDIMTMVFRDI